MIYNNSKQRNGWNRCKVNAAVAARLTPVRRARAEVNEYDVYLQFTCNIVCLGSCAAAVTCHNRNPLPALAMHVPSQISRKPILAR